MAKASGTDPSVLPLPQGGGAQRPIDETFQTNLSTGSGTYEIPLQLPRGAGGATPSLALRYSTGAGNGPFGMGWTIGLPSIARRTERRLPRFDEGVLDDTFYLGGRELTPDGPDTYREIVQVEPARIRRVTATDAWEVRSQTGLTMRFGTSPGSRTGPAGRTLEWHLSETTDANGNAIAFGYTVDGGRSYLTSVEYSIYRVELAYEERPDAHSSFRSGDEIRTARRCSAITLLLLEPAPRPVKTYRLGYAQAPHSALSLLSTVQLVALEQEDPEVAAVETPLPPVTLEYTAFEPSARRIEVFGSSSGSRPPSLLQPDMTLLDFEGTGRPGVIEIRNGTARFWRNEPGLRWGSPRVLRDLPATADLRTDSLRFVDMEGNGTADLLVGGRRDAGYYPNEPGGGWGRKVEHRQTPSVSVGTPGVRMLDVDGDNRPDLVHSDARAFYHYLNRGAEGWASEPIVVPRKHDLEEWPDVDLGSPHVRFADVVGDGRSHLVVVHDRRIVYYPNLGLGRWGPVRRMANAPRLPRNYDPGRLFLADVDGDGTADVIYVGFDAVHLWLNQSGNAFGDPIVLSGTPPVANAAVLIADMKGTGTQGILWSYEGALRRSHDFRYLDLAGGTKPLLLHRIANNSGVVTSIAYGSSTQWSAEDDPEVPPGSFLPFPVPVVERLEAHDPSTGVTSVSSFSYWDGHYDGAERAFLGFGKAQRIDGGDASIPANRTLTYFHNREVLLKGMPRLSLTFADDGTAEAAKPYVEEKSSYEVAAVHTTPAGVEIRAVGTSATVKKTFEREDTADEVRMQYEIDGSGNVTSEQKTSVWIDDSGVRHEDVATTTRTYATDSAGNATGFVARETTRNGTGTPVSGKRIFYDGPAFAGLPEGQVEKGNPTRERRFVMTAASAGALFAPGDPTPEQLGYHREDDADFGDAYFVDVSAQKVDARGNAIERRDPRGGSSTIEYDAFGIHPVRAVFANGLTFEAGFEYRFGQVTLHRGPSGAPERFGYDAAGRLVASWRHDDPEDKPYLEYEHHDGPVASLVTLTRSAPGAAKQHRRVEYFDGLGESLQVRAEAEDGKVAVTGRKEYNAKGLVFREHQAYFSQTFDLSDDGQPPDFTEYHYDARGRSTLRIDWHGNRYESRYGRGVRRHLDPLDLNTSPGNPAADTPRVEWLDADERTVAVVEEKHDGSYVTRYEHDLLGNRTKVTVNGSTFLENTFDGLGRRIRSAYRDAGVYTHVFDAAGNLVKRTDGKGDVLFRTYDVVNRVLELRYDGPAGPLQESYRYDVGEPGEENTAGSVTRVSGPFGEVRYAYSKCGCLRAKTRIYPGLAEPLTVRYETDSLRRFTKIVYPDGHEQVIRYTDGGLVEALPGVVEEISYGPTGKRTQVRFESGVVTDYIYDPGSLRLTRLRTAAPGGAVTYQDLTYTHDALGDITAVADGATRPGHVANDRTFGYDELQQLVFASGTDASGPYAHHYGYDQWGNPELFSERFGTDRILHQDAPTPLRITGVENHGAQPYAYDDAGNLTKSLHATYEYDARNRLVKVTGDDGVETEFVYDHTGTRLAVTTSAGGTATTTFNFDDIYSVTGGVATKTIFDDQSEIASIAPDGSGVVFHKDHLGSHVVESDLATGAFLREQTYYAFGAAGTTTALTESFGFAGKKAGEDHGLVFFGGRYYLPEIGRFLTPDPLFLEQQPDRFFRAPRSLELYVYVLNNPVNMIDPYGLWFGIDDAIAAAVGFVVGAVAYGINVAISGGDFSFSEMFFSGLAGAATMWLAWTLGGPVGAFVAGAAMLAKPALTGALDKAAMGNDAGSRFLGFLSFAIKFASAPITTTIGLLIGGVGTGFGLWGGVEWFKGGVIAFEYDPAGGPFTAVTLGGTVNIWAGNTNDPSFLHELYHSRQYTYFGDLFVPMWLIGGVYGLISSWIAGSPQWGCYVAGSPTGGYGNPLEVSAHTIDGASICI